VKNTLFNYAIITLYITSIYHTFGLHLYNIISLQSKKLGKPYPLLSKG